MNRPAAPAHKRRRGLGERFRRLVLSALDLRAWAHLIRLVNYWNYSHVAPLRRVTRGEGVAITPDVVFSNPERIEIGDGVTLGSRCFLWAGNATGRIRIGRNALFAPEVFVTAAAYRFNDGAPVTRQAMDEADVEIGEDVWLGARAMVLPGARIGAGAIIGAGAVVRGEIPPMAIAVGAPARVVGTRRLSGD